MLDSPAAGFSVGAARVAYRFAAKRANRIEVRICFGLGPVGRLTSTGAGGGSCSNARTTSAEILNNFVPARKAGR